MLPPLSSVTGPEPLASQRPCTIWTAVLRPPTTPLREAADASALRSRYRGTATAARMPRMMITMMSSSGVKPGERQRELSMRRREHEALFEKASRLLDAPLLEQQGDIDLPRIGVRGLAFQDRGEELLRLGDAALIDERHGAAEFTRRRSRIGGYAIAFIDQRSPLRRLCRRRRFALGFRRLCLGRRLDWRRLEGERQPQ